MIEPTDCSWIWRKVLQFRSLVLSLLTFKIGNGCNISLWFDPWWNNECLASDKYETIISQSGLSPNVVVNDLIHTGLWVLPTPDGNIHHIHQGLASWISNFDQPDFNPYTAGCDSLEWCSSKENKGLAHTG